MSFAVRKWTVLRRLPPALFWAGFMWGLLASSSGCSREARPQQSDGQQVAAGNAKDPSTDGKENAAPSSKAPSSADKAATAEPSTTPIVPHAPLDKRAEKANHADE